MNPTSDQVLRQSAEAYASRGDWPQSLAAFGELLRRHPADADVLLQLSYVSSLAGDYRQAHACALQAAAAKPRNPQQILELIARLRTFNEAPALKACLDRLLPADRMPVPLLVGFAAQLSYLGEQSRGLELLDVAKQLEPANPSILLARGQVLAYLGRLDEAEQDVLACLAQSPGMWRAWPLLVGLRRQTPEFNQVAPLRRLLGQPQLPAEVVAELGYALHKSLDDLGEYDKAWSALEMACLAKRSTLTYRSQDSQELVDALLSYRLAPVGQTLCAAQLPGPTPVFIVGMHRSGTTLLEQLLQGHSDVRGLGELYDFTCQMRQATGHHCRGVIDDEIVRLAIGVDFDAVGKRYLEGVAWRLGSERVFIDKLPSNFLNAGFICRALPQAKVLHMRRNPMDTCFSNLRELFLDANPYSYDQAELGAFYRQYERLMEHWSKSFPDRILDVRYERLVEQPEEQLRAVVEFCGLPYEQGMQALRPAASGVSTASAVAIHQGVIKREAPKWAPYARYLARLQEVLAG
jgi:tetratricopeptide (TPR) repeat protein